MMFNNDLAWAVASANACCANAHDYFKLATKLAAHNPSEAKAYFERAVAQVACMAQWNMRAREIQLRIACV